MILSSIMLRFGTMQIFIKTLHMKDGITNIVFADNKDLADYKDEEEKQKGIPADEIKMDWEKKYPFQKDAIDTEDASSITGESELFSVLKERIETYRTKIERWTNRYLWHYIDAVQLAEIYKNDILAWNIRSINEYNGVVQLPDGQLAAFVRRKNVEENVANVSNLARMCQNQGVHFVMVLAPSKIARSETMYAGKLDFSNQNGDDFVQGLRANGVDRIDIRDDIEEEHLDQHDLFYRTDHHWKASTARWATRKIFAYLNQSCGYQADVSLLDSQKYEEAVYPSWFLGSRGKKLTLARTTPDDFSLYYPKFKTSFTMFIPSMQLKKQGDFSIMYMMKEMDFAGGSYKHNPYGAYAYGDRAYIDICNLEKHDGKRLLFIHDSFGDAVTPFLALGMEHLQTLDPRHFRGSIRTFIQKEKPDTVVVLYYIEELGSSGKPAKPTQQKGVFDLR